LGPAPATAAPDQTNEHKTRAARNYSLLLVSPFLLQMYYCYFYQSNSIRTMADPDLASGDNQKTSLQNNYTFLQFSFEKESEQRKGKGN